MNELIPSENRAVTAADIKAGVQLIQQVMESVMIKDVHYGTIPGTPKPTLYKAGSEKILTTFRIAAYPKEVEDLSTYDEARFRVKVHGIHQTTGMLIGVGIGECSSMEEKYKWRKPVCDQEFNETPEDRRRAVWKKGKDGAPPYQAKQIRTQPADVANTVLKMAKKRAQIDMTLTATAASDVFDQDLEDLPEGMAGDGEKKAPVSSSVKKKAPEGKDKTVNDTLAEELAAYCPDEAIEARPAQADHGVQGQRRRHEMGGRHFEDVEQVGRDRPRQAPGDGQEKGGWGAAGELPEESAGVRTFGVGRGEALVRPGGEGLPVQ